MWVTFTVLYEMANSQYFLDRVSETEFGNFASCPTLSYFSRFREVKCILLPFSSFLQRTFGEQLVFAAFLFLLLFSLEAGEFTTKFVKFAYGLGLRCICSCGTSVCVACVCLGCVYLLFVVKAIKMRSSITRKFEWTSCRRDFVRVIYRRAIFFNGTLVFLWQSEFPAAFNDFSSA